MREVREQHHCLNNNSWFEVLLLTADACVSLSLYLSHTIFVSSSFSISLSLSSFSFKNVLLALSKQNHAITAFGIGTNLVTCQAQPALGCVYKLVEINNIPRIKLSQDIAKILVPGRKNAYRIYSSEGEPLLDLLVRINDVDDVPVVGKRFLCRHPFEEKKRLYVTPSRIEELLECVWDGENGGLQVEIPKIMNTRKFVQEQIKVIRSDVKRNLNPAPYKVSVTQPLYEFIHNIWEREAPIVELR
jgi:nicotinate phosphoribosyltransferase